MYYTKYQLLLYITQRISCVWSSIVATEKDQSSKRQWLGFWLGRDDSILDGALVWPLWALAGISKIIFKKYSDKKSWKIPGFQSLIPKNTQCKNVRSCKNHTRHSNKTREVESFVPRLVCIWYWRQQCYILLPKFLAVIVPIVYSLHTDNSFGACN